MQPLECSLIVSAIRRSVDCAVALVVLAVLSPVMLVVVLAIRADSPGTVLFRQKRLGLGQQTFTLYKFRTMETGGDQGAHREYVSSLIAGDERPHTRHNQTLFKAPMESYVTRVGRRLRSWSIDEVPQLWNVLRGEMALIGPRPVIPYEASLYRPEWDMRFAVKPGLTGLWQVSGRSRLTYAEMVELDLEYVRRRSLRLDASILLRTIPTVLLRRGVT